MWIYELFVLPPDTSPSPVAEVEVEDTGGIRVRGEYSFGTEGATVDIEALGRGWSSNLRVVDVAGVSGEVKRIEDLQEFSLGFRRGKFALQGGIMTEELPLGRAKGEGVKVGWRGDSLLYLRKYAPTVRREITLTENYAGPYVFSDRPVMGRSLKVYLNGRPLDEGDYTLAPEGNALYLRTEFGEGDILTVEYQTASLSPSYVLGATAGMGPLKLHLYHERPALKVVRGCAVVRGGDYLLKGDTFLLVPGRGNLSCTFLPSDSGGYDFLGDRYVPHPGGGYALVPPDTSPTSYLASTDLNLPLGRASLTGGKVGDSASYGGRWNLGVGSRLRLFTSGDIFWGRRPSVPHYSAGRWGRAVRGEANVGMAYRTGRLSLSGEVSAGLGDRPLIGYGVRGRYGWLFAGYDRYPVRWRGEVGLGGERGEVAYEYYGDTASNFRGGRARWGPLAANVRRYGDGFLGYAVKVEGWGGSLSYSVSPKGRSLLGRVGLPVGPVRLGGEVRSSQGFRKVERFVYVGKGWGDYERDSTGNFVPFPYGSYRKEAVYFPINEATYDLSLYAYGQGYGVQGSGKLGRRLERYDVALHLRRELYRVSVRAAGDLTADRAYYERRGEGRVGRPLYLGLEALDRTFGGDTVRYISGEVGYSRRWLEGGVEVMRGRAFALSPIVRTRGSLSLEAGYRVFLGEGGPEVRYKPPGPFLSLTLNLSRRLKDVRLNGGITGGYDRIRKGFYTFSFGVSGSL